ncbi:zinc finger protein 668-like [Ornithodoros turicata]|uniref:zinc finger protein 668-like n=1 Tax=Ornithodoros turicata TaxID=34597 RepID=UPI00313993D5
MFSSWLATKGFPDKDDAPNGEEHNEPTRPCMVCKMRFTNAATPEAVTGCRLQCCRLCSALIPPSRMLRHISDMHINIHRCATCDEGFASPEGLDSHYTVTHHGVGPSQQPARPLEQGSPETSFICKFCGKSFQQQVVFKLHLRMHRGPEPFYCAKCKKRFATDRDLKSHSNSSAECLESVPDSLKATVGCQEQGVPSAEHTSMQEIRATTTEEDMIQSKFCSDYVQSGAGAPDTLPGTTLSAGASGRSVDVKNARNTPRRSEPNVTVPKKRVKTRAAPTNGAVQSAPPESNGCTLAPQMKCAPEAGEPATTAQVAAKPNENGGFKCQHCAKVFKKLKNLETHSLIHKAGKPFRCTQCSSSYLYKHAYLSHVAKKHPEDLEVSQVETPSPSS